MKNKIEGFCISKLHIKCTNYKASKPKVSLLT
jgi:hypothetical protein